MLKLPEVTLVTCSNVNIEKTIFAMEHSLSLAQFGDAKFITNEVYFDHSQFEVIQEPRLKDYCSYSEVMLFELHKYIETKFCLIIQADGFILNPNKWQNDFMEYDYIGACIYNNKFWGEGEVKVGNGGFSLRSKKILSAPHEYFGNEKNFRDYFNYYPGSILWEDYAICVTAGEYYKSKGIKFATENIANQFSIEPYHFDSPKNSFGFHYGNIDLMF